MKNSQKRGYKTEKQKSKEHRGKHLGGPGKPDYKRGKVKGEVKNKKFPVTSTEVKKALKKGITEIDSKSGFTKPAIEEAKKHKMKLFKRKKNVT